MKKSLKTVFYILSMTFFFNVSHAGKIEIYMIKSLTEKGLFIYEDPTIHSAKIVKIPAKAKWIIKRSKKRLYSKQYWRKITWNKKTGWVKANELILDPKATRNAKKDKRCLNSHVRPASCSR
ncbi:MAG: Unknown protein [uncultured Thiotrichaceae bacterium]|uniref:SH3b domain-containing protein n=1 Tax=uncultured Thiotrichaceae bacterium TaxID=298394 RepID=A0A6S6TXH8_9GAMM|nr:MAG: Unknown protein [uncultured Thiotrichaceae bacterium]